MSIDHPLLLAGREAVLHTLWQTWEQIRNGGIAVVLLSGEPGIGKTRLLDTLADHATQNAISVLRGSAVEAEGMPPYLPFLEAFGRYIIQADHEQIQLQIGENAPMLAPLFPELTRRLGLQAPPYTLPPEQSRLRLYEAIGRFLAEIAAPGPLLLLLDDLHWADLATLDLLAHLTRQLGKRGSRARILIIAAYRPGEIIHSAAFEQTLVELNRLRRLINRSLEALDEAVIGAIAQTVLGTELAPATRQLLWTHSEGNPFFAEELLRDWVERGALVEENGRLVFAEAADHLLPTSIVLAVRSRLARLAPEVVELLRAAALIGRTCPLLLLAQVVEQDLEALEGALDVAVRAHLVRLTDEAQLIFTHDMVRKTLYTEISASRRRRLHGRIGHMLEQTPGVPDAQRLAHLAFHFAQAGDRERGSSYAMQAAESALEAAAAETALAYYRTALDLSDRQDGRRGKMLMGAGTAAVAAGLESDGISLFANAQTWFSDHKDKEQAAQAALHRGHAAWRLEDLASAQAAFEEACSLLADQPGPLLAQALLDLGNLLAMSLHQQAAGMAACQRALELAYACEEQRVVAAASRAMGNALVRAGNLQEGIVLLERGLALAETVDDPVEASECAVLLAHACYWRGDLRRTYALADQLISFAQRTHDPYQLRHVYALQAQGALMQGRWDAAEQWLAIAQREVESLASPEPRAFVEMICGNLAYERGDDEAAERHYTIAITTFRALGPGALVWYLGQYGLAQLAAQQSQTARETANELAALASTLPQGAIPTVTVQCMLALIALELGDKAMVETLAPQLAPLRGHYLDVLVDRVLGQIATAHGDWETAQAALDSAEAAARGNNLLPELGRVLRAQAELAQARGGAASKATEQLRAEAIALYEQLGNQREIARLRSLTRGINPARPPASVFPAGLSVREVEVLRLVAAGKSNRVIAQTLVISEKTVANHLSNIFAKTGADNRAAATAFAIRHSLA